MAKAPEYTSSRIWNILHGNRKTSSPAPDYSPKAACEGDPRVPSNQAAGASKGASMSCPYCAVGGNGHSAQCPVWQQSQQAQAAQQFHTGLGGLYLPLPPYPLPIPLPSSPLPAPDHPELLDLISYRVWLLSPAGFLKSTARHFTWLPGEIIEGNPSLNHNGIHSYKTIQGALDHTITPPQVIGSILSWGEVIEHENGYRSQFAKINSLDYIILPGVSPWDLQNEVALRWLRHKYLLPEEASNEP